MPYMNFGDLNKEMKKPLDYKIDKAVEALREAFRLKQGGLSVAFSGGKDSTVLWHLIRTYFPDEEYHVIFGNTTVEFPESLKFARKLGREWAVDYEKEGEITQNAEFDGVGKAHFHEVLPARLEHDELKYQAQREVLQYCIDNGLLGQILKDDGKLKTTQTLENMATPEMLADFEKRSLIWKKGTRKSYNYCTDQYGFPILGKAACKLVAKRINIDCFLMFSESTSNKSETTDYYDLLRNVKTSNHCCSILKKEPSEAKQKELNVNVVVKGLMASESHSRALSFCTRGYIFKSSRPYAKEFYHVSPLSIWTDDDIWDYIYKYNVPYSSLYEIEYENGKGETCRIKRNGCVGCATDIAFKDNHISTLRKTHPCLYNHYMTHGLGDEIMHLQLYKTNGNLNLMNVACDAEQVMRIQPCAFDDVEAHVVKDEFTTSEYDADDVEENDES